MTTNAYAIKGALFTLLGANEAALRVGTSRPDDPVQVEYTLPTGDIGMRCVYGGSVRFSHRNATAEGVGLVVEEEALIGLYVRVASSPARPAADDDADVAQIGRNIIALVKANAALTGPTRWLGLSGGLGVAGGTGGAGGGQTVATDHESISVLGYQLRFGSMLSY